MELPKNFKRVGKDISLQEYFAEKPGNVPSPLVVGGHYSLVLDDEDGENKGKPIFGEAEQVWSDGTTHTYQGVAMLNREKGGQSVCVALSSFRAKEGIDYFQNEWKLEGLVPTDATYLEIAQKLTENSDKVFTCKAKMHKEEGLRTKTYDKVSKTLVLA